MKNTAVIYRTDIKESPVVVVQLDKKGNLILHVHRAGHKSVRRELQAHLNYDD